MWWRLQTVMRTPLVLASTVVNNAIAPDINTNAARERPATEPSDRSPSPMVVAVVM